MEHPSDEILQRFAQGTASREERRAVVAHLIQGCSQCARKLRALLKPQPVTTDAYDAVLDRFGREVLDRLKRLVQPAGEACRATASAAFRAASGSPR